MRAGSRPWLPAARDVLAGLRVAAPRSSASGSPGQMHGLVCLDARGAVIRPAILWNDQRSAPQCAAMESGERESAAAAAHRQPGTARFHCAKTVLDARERAGCIRAHPPDLPAQGLRPRPARSAGIAATSPTRRERCSSMSAERRWSGELLEELGIPVAWLPELAESGGRSRDVATAWPVAAGAGDQAAAAVGGGIIASRAAVGRARNVRGGARGHRRIPRRSRRARPRLLPRGAGALDGHGCDAVGGRIPRLVSRHAQSGHGLRRPARRG